MSFSSILLACAKLAASVLFESAISSAVTILFPTKSLLQATILGKSISIKTSDVASSLIMHGFTSLINTEAELPTKVTRYDEEYSNIQFEGRGSSLDILRSNNMGRIIDFNVPKPLGLHLPDFPPIITYQALNFPQVQKFSFQKNRRRWNILTHRWEFV